MTEHKEGCGKGADQSLLNAPQTSQESTCKHRSYCRTLQLTKSRLRECVTSHSCVSYGPVSKDFLPTRLLDVGVSTEEIKLVTTSQEEITDTRYVALSYCWGNDPTANFTTTDVTLPDRLSGFPSSRMPLTLQDAVQVTQSQGLRYLWIDALCIIQQNADDWRSESTRMDQIYGNAYFTIVAASSTNVQGGLFKSGLYSERPPCTLLNDGELFAVPENATDIALVNQLTPKLSSKHRFPLHKEAISSRAWALQEWLLSRRLFVFTNSGIFFICDEYNVNTLHRVHKTRLAGLVHDERDWWEFIVMNFCSRSLTNSDDKLPAISGLAKRFASLISYQPEDYLAGLWRSRMINELCWYHEDTKDYSWWLPVPDSLGRSRRAPSWSWASVDGPIHFQIQRRTCTLQATLNSCETTATKSDPTSGVLERGTLVITCPFKHIRLWEERGRRNSQMNVKSGSKDGFFGPYWGDDSSETKLFLGKRTDLFCAALKSETDHIAGLVLAPYEEQTTFIRVGYFRVYDKSWKAKMEGEMTFTII